MEHELVMVSLADMRVTCSCGCWTYGRAGALMREIQETHREHVEAVGLDGNDQATALRRQVRQLAEQKYAREIISGKEGEKDGTD